MHTLDVLWSNAELVVRVTVVVVVNVYFTEHIPWGGVRRRMTQKTLFVISERPALRRRRPWRQLRWFSECRHLLLLEGKRCVLVLFSLFCYGLVSPQHCRLSRSGGQQWLRFVWGVAISEGKGSLFGNNTRAATHLRCGRRGQRSVDVLEVLRRTNRQHSGFDQLSIAFLYLDIYISGRTGDHYNDDCDQYRDQHRRPEIWRHWMAGKLNFNERSNR